MIKSINYYQKQLKVLQHQFSATATIVAAVYEVECTPNGTKSDFVILNRRRIVWPSELQYRCSKSERAQVLFVCQK